MDLRKFFRKFGFITDHHHSGQSYGGSSVGLVNRKIMSMFIGTSLVLLTIIFVNYPLNPSNLYPMFQGFTSKSPIVSWPFNFSNGGSGSSSGGGDGGNHVLPKVSGSGGRLGDIKESDLGDVVGKSVNEGSLGVKSREEGKLVKDVSFSENNGSFSGGSGTGGGVTEKKGGDQDGNFTSDSGGSGNQTIGGGVGGGNQPLSEGEGVMKKSGGDQKENNSGGNGGVVGSENENLTGGGEKQVTGGEGVKEKSGGDQKANISGSGGEKHDLVGSGVVEKRRMKDCDIFDGRWVKDEGKPYYPGGSCPYIDRDFDCHLNGRKDEDFVKWRWQPNHCDIPSLNATDFLERLRGKRIVFVGDSLNRNMWESLVCILRQSVPNKKKVYEISGKKEFKKRGFYAFHFEDYNCSIDFVSTPFLVQESSFKGVNGTIDTLRLDLMDRTTSMYHDADVIVFNTGHWWTHEKTSKGENYYQEGNKVYPRLKVMEAFQKALNTWAKWIDKNVDQKRTQVIYRGYSVTHFRGGQWNSGGQCHKETEPIFNGTYLAKYPSKMKALEQVLPRMKTPIMYMNISKLTDYRKDAHPSIYRKVYNTVEEQIAAVASQDCSHWCLPGVPDTWNELLYASLLKVGRGSWKT